ncbi:MAG: HEPN domain-containing protein [Ilumatobacteraceae bacterium]
MSGLKRLTRVHDELRAATVLQAADLPAQAVSRAYFAAFSAAETALFELGATRSKQGGVIAAFVQLVVRAGGCDERAGRLLRNLFERRGQADHSIDPVPPVEGDRSIADAEIVVALIETWLDGRI